MDLLTSLKISASGLSANRKRIKAINSNIANAETTRTAEGGPYRRKSVVFGAEPARENFSDVLEGTMNESAQTVHATEVISDNSAAKPVYNPKHPDADENGYVWMPDINPMAEMADLISAQRSYEANISAIKAVKAMANKALEIGR